MSIFPTSDIEYYILAADALDDMGIKMTRELRIESNPDRCLGYVAAKRRYRELIYVAQNDSIKSLVYYRYGNFLSEWGEYRDSITAYKSALKLAEDDSFKKKIQGRLDSF